MAVVIFASKHTHEMGTSERQVGPNLPANPSAIDDCSASANRSAERKPIEHAVGLPSQQVRCPGPDVVRSEGNCLLKVGFQRLRQPASRENSSSIFVWKLPRGRRVVQRGFGVFVGNRTRRDVFLPRCEIKPKYTLRVSPDCPLWFSPELRNLDSLGDLKRNVPAESALDAFGWIRGYGMNVTQQLGVACRRHSLAWWNNGERAFIRAEKVATAWRALSFQVAADLDAFSRKA